MQEKEKIAVLFSGGVDSLLVAAKVSKKAKEIYLLTCVTQFITFQENVKKAMEILQKQFPDNLFISVMLSAKNILKLLWDGRALRDIFKVGFYRAYPCAVCKFSMHVRALVYCIENKINQVYDGANVMMSFNPCQNNKGRQALEEFYRFYGITYQSPVYWYENVDIMLFSRFSEFRDDSLIQRKIVRGKSTN
ncbi:hypothetical protein ACFL5X_03285 [Candidatus Omnitrophota bacterium]